MRAAWIAAIVTLWAGAAAAQWSFENTETGAVARGCSDPARGGQSLCLELSCADGAPLAWGLTTETVAELVAAPSAEALVFVGSRDAGTLDFRATGPGTFRAPLRETHLGGIDWLKRGLRAELRLWAGADAPFQSFRVGLIGSRKAIEAVEAACPMPDFEAAEREARTLEDPETVVLGQIAEACAALDGMLTVQEGFAREVELDGANGPDFVIAHGLAACSTTPELLCGAGGCLHSVWLARDDGRYLRVFEDYVDTITPVEPGVLEMRRPGAGCGRDEAGCITRYGVTAEGLEAF
ncbi:hypothetical protein [Pseudoponticoccus marisrubri]|uniref:Uncharacterized protein n=1 Tax=Pseudoponticoccus marisrubri TaxID=1685382 RepID=A0A0W7WGU5_9RHOB|nr:hypothetical protein [Pseudoponticoccus marisrubri]KUF09688.1 hypothetical protein AVJ23_16165 [Pseudoponticoccus marisrubri]